MVFYLPQIVHQSNWKVKSSQVATSVPLLGRKSPSSGTTSGPMGGNAGCSVPASAALLCHWRPKNEIYKKLRSLELATQRNAQKPQHSTQAPTTRTLAAEGQGRILLLLKRPPQGHSRRKGKRESSSSSSSSSHHRRF